MMKLQQSIGYQIIKDWLSAEDLSAFKFQEETWDSIYKNKSGLVNAPTGSGKTFSVFLGALIQFINQNPLNYKIKKNNGLQLLWISPLRALAKDLQRAMEDAINEIGMAWKVGSRNGDTPSNERQKQQRNMPEILIITPESFHLMLALKNNADLFSSLKIIAVDEWHELLGTKRGVQVELALSRVKGMKSTSKDLMVWGISATIGNLNEAKDILMASFSNEAKIIKAALNKKIEIHSIFPDEIEKYPWAGHLGLKLADKIIPIIEESKTTLIFINTRGMSERWYQAILNLAPDLAGLIALHHGSLDRELREWVEESLHTSKLKAVVCTASLDLGVDFRPVDTVIQVGSPKGISRFLQRAGRSGHQPGETSKIFFLPTHSLELAEVAALKQAIKEDIIESRQPMLLCYDVLIQYLCTLAVGDGFIADTVFNEVKKTFCYKDITEEEFGNILYYITQGGNALQQYDEFKKVEIENGIYKIKNRRIAMRHRMHIGTIVSEAMLKVKLMSGKYVGVIEEWFISRLDPGSVFTLSGRNLELIAIKDMQVITKISSSKKSIVPSWQGGRMPLSSNLGTMLRIKLAEVSKKQNKPLEKELAVLQPLFELQRNISAIPAVDELLIEHIETKDGFHVFIYPFEGRLVHEAMAALIAYRISRFVPITFSIAMNDYGFELLSDKPIPIDDSTVYDLFTTKDLLNDINRSVNSVEMAKRKFRDIAVIGGLVFQGFPGENVKARHLQSSASLIFSVLSEYEPGNLLLKQSYQEVLDQQMEEVRLRNALSRIMNSRIIIQYPDRLTPFCFPIKVDSMRENLTSEKLEDRIARMQEQLEK